MGFLENVKRGSKVAGSAGVNPFATKTKPSTGASVPSGVAPAVSVVGSKPTPPSVGVRPTMPKPTMPRPSMPVGMAKPSVPTMPKPTSPVAPSPVDKATKNEENKGTAQLDGQVSLTDVLPQENVVKETLEEKKEVASVEVKEEVKAAEPKTEEVKEEKKTSKAKGTRSTRGSKKKTDATSAEASVSEEAENAEIQEALFIERLYKMPVNTMTYAEAVKCITANYEDTGWSEIKQALIEECDAILIEQDMNEGAVKKVNAQLDALRNKIWVDFSNTQSLCIQLSNSSSKEAEGLIERAKYLNMEGSNEIARKRSGIIAAMNYTVPSGERVNLYQIYDIAKAKLQFYSDLMKTIDWKKNSLITVNTCNKQLNS